MFMFGADYYRSSPFNLYPLFSPPSAAPQQLGFPKTRSLAISRSLLSASGLLPVPASSASCATAEKARRALCFPELPSPRVGRLSCSVVLQESETQIVDFGHSEGQKEVSIIEDMAETVYDMSVFEDDACRTSISERIKKFLEAPMVLKAVSVKPVGNIVPESKPRNASSILWKAGVIVSDNKGSRWFLCLHDNCVKEGKQMWIKLSQTSTSNATTHLNQLHAVLSKKTLTVNANIAKIKEQLECSQESFLANPTRWFQYVITAWATEHSIPFNAFTTDRWKIVAGRLPIGDGGLKNINVPKLMVEQYIYAKNLIRVDIQMTREWYRSAIAFMALNIDLYRNRFSNQKYVACRISYIVRGQDRSWNVAVRRYAPTTNERRMQRASDLIIQWVRSIMEEYSIVMAQDVLTSATDSGSDIKRALEIVSPTLREWCISHLAHLALSDAFGTCLNAANSKNPEARQIIKKVRKMAEAVNKSEDLQALLDDLMFESFNYLIKMKNSPAHRWSAIDDVLVRILICFAQLKEAFRRKGKVFSCVGDKEVLLEFRSIIVPIRTVQVLAQRMKKFVIIDVYIKMASNLSNVLNPCAPLKIHDPTPADGSALLMRNARAPVVDAPSRSVEDLDPRSTRVRQLLRTAMSERYYDRYHPLKALRYPSEVYGHTGTGTRVRMKVLNTNLTATDFKFSYLFDMQVLLCPGLAAGGLIKNQIDQMHINNVDVPLGWNVTALRNALFEFIKTLTWETISVYAERIAESTLDKEMEEEQLPAAKRSRANESDDLLAEMLQIGVGVSVDVTMTPELIVKEEIEKLKSLDRKEGPEHFSDLPNWWYVKRDEMSCLAMTASAFLANKASSGGLECDLGGMNDVLAPKRSTLRPGLVEVAMFNKLNKHLIPTDPGVVNDVGGIWETLLPDRPPMPDEGDNNDDEDDNDECFVGSDVECEDSILELGDDVIEDDNV